jgi:hypothetical protein
MCTITISTQVRLSHEQLRSLAGDTGRGNMGVGLDENEDLFGLGEGGSGGPEEGDEKMKGIPDPRPDSESME